MNIYSEERPWGKFEKFVENQTCTVKLINVNPYSRLSLQYHNKRKEFWKIIEGSAEVEIDEKKYMVNSGDNITIPLGARHRIKALDKKCLILEISFGEFDESDIVRLEDDYDRIK